MEKIINFLLNALEEEHLGLKDTYIKIIEEEFKINFIKDSCKGCKNCYPDNLFCTNKFSQYCINNNLYKEKNQDFDF